MVREIGWLEFVVSRRRHKEGRTKHRDSTLISDHRGELHWHNEHGDSRRLSLKGGKAVRVAETESQKKLWTELWSKICKVKLWIVSSKKTLIVTLLQSYQLGKNPMDLG